MRIVVYDLETKNKPVTNEQWKNWSWMGISVGCAYDFSTGEYSVYLEDNLVQLVNLLNSADMIAAFNHVSFDNNLLRGLMFAKADTYGHGMLRPDNELLNYDMLIESRTGAKVDSYVKGFKLDAHLKATLGPEAMKTGDGAMAPDLFKQGKMGELVSYCLADVHRERLLFERVWEVGCLACEHNAGIAHPVRRPHEMLGLPMNMPIKGIAHLPGRVEFEARKAHAPEVAKDMRRLLGVDQAAPGAVDKSVVTTINGDDL